MLGFPRDRIARVVTALIVAAMTTVGSLYLFAAGARERFEPLESLSSLQAGGVLLPEPGLPPESSMEAIEEEEEPAAEPLIQQVKLQRSVLVSDYLVRAGLNVFEAQRWANAFRSAAHGRTMSRGHLVSLEKDPDSGQLRGLRYDVDEQVEIVERALGNGVILATQQPIRYQKHPVSVAFEIRNSLEADAARHHVPKAVIARLQEAFNSKSRGSHSRRATGLKVVYEEYVSPDGAHRMAGDLQAAEFQTTGASQFAFALRDSRGRSHLYDEQGKPLGQQFLRYPVPFEYVSSGFSTARYHPILHYYRRHAGIDLVARYGTPVKAIADGRVEMADWNGDFGRCIRLEHDRGLVSIYGHLSKISRSVREGAYVSVGQIIGWVGTSGLSTGPHLHFALMKNGDYLNPLTVRLDSEREISPRAHVAFEKLKQEYRLVLSRLPMSGERVEAEPYFEPVGSSTASLREAKVARNARQTSVRRVVQGAARAL